MTAWDGPAPVRCPVFEVGGAPRVRAGKALEGAACDCWGRNRGGGRL